MSKKPIPLITEEQILKTPKKSRAKKKTQEELEEEALLEELTEEALKEEPKEVEIDIPIPQKDPCCAKLCDNLNEEVEARRSLLGFSRTKVIRMTAKGEYIEGSPVNIVEIPYPSTTHDLDAMENLRDRLRDEGSCNCAKKKTVPIEKAPPTRLTTSRFPTTLSARLTRTLEKKKPITPISSQCCADTCRILNDEIKSIDDELDVSTAKQGEIATKTPRFEALAYQVFMLKNYRTDLKNKSICSCEE